MNAPLTRKEACLQLGCSETWFRGWLDDNPGYGYRIGREYRFLPTDIIAIREALNPKPVAEPVDMNPWGWIYFIESGGFVKIGFSSDWRKRINHIKTASPLPVRALYAFEGWQAEERRLQGYFRAFRHKGEWFRHEGKLAQWIARRARVQG